MAFDETLENYFSARFGGDHDDEIIPNDYNIKSDFRKKASEKEKKAIGKLPANLVFLISFLKSS